MKPKQLIFLAPLAVVVLLAIFLAPKFVNAPAHSGTELATKYISGQEWPPKITTTSGTFSCKEGGSEIMPATAGKLGGITTKRIINGRAYCVLTQGEGAAGSIYATYKYTTTYNQRLTTLDFVLRYPQCANYSDPQKTECLAERQTFDLDGLVDKIVTSVKIQSGGLDIQPVTENEDAPPLLLKSIGFDLGYYDAGTGMAGDIQFTKLPLKNNFGLIMADFGMQDPRTSDPTKTNPQPVFILPLGTKVHALVDGIVTNVQQLYGGDYTIMVAKSEGSNWIYETEHVNNPLVKKGDRVTGGQVIAEVSDRDTVSNPGFGIVEIGILHGGNPPHHVCPFAYLDNSIKDDIQKKITALHNDWEAYRGDTSLYQDSSTYVLPGCATLDPANG